MRLPVLVLAALVGSCVAPPPEPLGPRQVTELVGRVAGAPQRCIPIQPDGNLRPSSSDPGTLLYGNGTLIWANHLSPGGCHFSFSDVMVLNPTGSSYCQNDVVRSVDASSRMPGPSCFMGPFIPYRR
jgi:hypothetical protein